MSERRLFLVALAVFTAAGVPVVVAEWVRVALIVAVLVAWRKGHAVAVALLLVTLTAAQAGVALDALDTVATERRSTALQLATDPEPTPGGLRFEAIVDGARIEARAWGSPAGHLRPRLAGEWVQATIDIRPLRDPPDWITAQGIVGRGTIVSVDGFTEGHLASRLANSIRRTMESGARSLSPDTRSLFTGLVYGDDRRQTPLVGDAFDGAGLTHLLAVSGQNVAFVLALAGPVLRRMGHRSRFVVVLAILAVFATMTRFEPSVMRASAMAAVAASGALLGTAASSKRVLAVAVIALLVVRPRLAGQVAFQLSVAASAGILAWSPRLALALPGPRPLAQAVGVTSAAQLAVAPLLLWRFGGLPVAALPANVLAGIAAGPIMMWGMTAGVVAGLVPSPVAAVLHVPTRLLVGWIDAVAEVCANLPLGELSAAHLALAGVATFLALHTTGPRRTVSTLVLIVALANPAAQTLLATPRSQPLDAGGHLWADGTTVVVELNGARRPQQTLGALRRSAVSDIDLVVVREVSFASAQMLTWIGERHDIAAVWSPQLGLGHGEVIPTSPTRIVLADLVLIVERTNDELAVTVDSG